MTSTLSTRDLTKSYGGRTVVRGVSIEVASGEIVGLLGPNGAGKTTTFYMTVGLTTPDAGRVVLDGEDVASVRIGLGGVAATPLRASATEEALLGRPWTLETVRAAASVLGSEGTPMSDQRASSEYRALMMQRSLVKLFRATAPERAEVPA